MAKFVDKRIDELKDVITQREIAEALDYPKPNIISMFKSGETKVPLNKLPPLASVLRTDLVLLLRLWLDQEWPGQLPLIDAIFNKMATANEQALVEAYRRAVGYDDYSVPCETLERVQKMIVDSRKV